MDDVLRIEPSFFSGAEELRAAFDANFSSPYAPEEWENRRIWNYWYVPNAYTYLRADPAQVLGAEILRRFMNRIRTWSVETLGLISVRRPILSVYVNGCGQNLHTDALKGRFAYVYSLTRWETRKFTGGETLVMPDESYWHSRKIVGPGSIHRLLSKIDASFDQLLLFDDRAIHGVETVIGTMDPREARIVLAGHIDGTHPWFDGALTAEAVTEPWLAQRGDLEALLAAHAEEYSGSIVLRWSVAPEGRVEQVEILSHRMRVVQGEPVAGALLDQILDWARSLRFPAAAGPSRVTIPIHSDAIGTPSIGTLHLSRK